MSTKRVLYTVAAASTSFTTEACWNGSDSAIRFTWNRDGTAQQGGIQFRSVSAFRQTAERCCTAWHVEEAYDTLVEVEDSTWVNEIRVDMDSHWQIRFGMHHYMIYLDSVGCFEVIAESWRAL